ncbi:UNVERIFIED_CONTAM: hypothetical protein K2H54_049102 [Gekko kuhli]
MPDDHPAQMVTVMSRSPSIYSRPPSEILDRGDSPTNTRRDRREWLTDIESGRRTRYSRSRSRSYRDDYLPLSRSHRYRRYSPDSRSPSSYTYARRYFASRDHPDSRLMSPYPRSRHRLSAASLPPNSSNPMMLEPLPIQTVRTGSEIPKMSLPFMGPVVDPDGHRFGTPQKPDLHRQTRTPGTIMLLGIDRTRDRDLHLGTVILGTEPSPHLSLVHLNLVRLEPRLARPPPLLLELLQSCTKARPSR